MRGLLTEQVGTAALQQDFMPSRQTSPGSCLSRNNLRQQYSGR
ncbi:hypothetical protein ABIB60_000063 [Hymenobacter sp. UYP22]